VSHGSDVLLQLGSRERCESLFLGWGMQDVARGKVLGLWVCGAANAVAGSGKIVAGVPELYIGVEQRPIGAGFSDRHANAACIHDSSRADHPIKLHVGMTTDDHGDVESFEDRQEAVIGRKAGKDVGVVARCGVAEQHIAEAGNRARHVGGQPSNSR
jgi:hypothetical protein